MSLFLMLLVAGLTGLICMALPGVARHGSTGAGAHGIGHAGHGAPHVGAHAPAIHRGGGQPIPRGGARAARGPGNAQESTSNVGWARLIPSPRTIFSFLALYGAFGYACTDMHLSIGLAAFLALIPAFLVERFAVTPLWNFLFKFQAEPCSALEEMIMEDAEAVTAFRNGRGLVSVVRDGRSVQFRAQLTGDQASVPVQVGDKLKIEEVDAAKERVTVSIHP